MSPLRSAPTLQQVADLAGVARPTASLALNGKGTLSQATRQRVIAAAQQLGYVPNAAARSLRTSRTGIVGIYLPVAARSHEKFNLELTLGAVERGSAAGYIVALIPSELPPGRHVLEAFEGFLLATPVAGDPVSELLLNSGKPVVSTGQPVGAAQPWAVAIGDHQAGARILLDHILEKGARSIAALLPDPSTVWGRQAEEHYRDWCAAHGIEPRLAYRLFTMDAAAVREQIDALLGDTPPDGLVLSGDEVGFTALEALRERGLVPGRDILLGTYVDNDAYASTTPSITSLDTRPREVGRTLMDLLGAALDGGERPQGPPAFITPELIERESTGRWERS